MSGSHAALSNSGSIACPAATTRTMIQYTVPSGAGGELKEKPTISFDGTTSAAAKVAVRVIRGATGGSGSSTVNPVAMGSNNPAGASLGSGKENFTGGEPTGGIAIFSDLIPPYGTNIPLGIPKGLILAPSETVGVEVTAPASVNVRINFPDIHI